MRWWQRPLAPAARAAASRSRSPAAGAAALLGASLGAPLLTMLTAVALETLPVTAWLETAATLQTGSPLRAAVPFWWLFATVLAAAALGALYRRHALPGAILAPLIVVGWLAALLVALRISPGGYASVSPAAPFALGWLGRIPGDVVAGSGRIAVALGLALLDGYLWWRGLRLGIYGATYDRVWLVFRLGLAAVVLALVVAAAASGPARSALGARLALLLPLEVGAGLVALALVHVADFASRHRPTAAGETPADGGAFGQTPWVLTALGLALVVVGGALLLALVFSYNALQALAQALQPVGNALGAAVEWVIEGVAYLLFLVLGGPVDWVQSHLGQPTAPPQGPPTPPRVPCGTHCATGQGLPDAWVTAGRVVFFVLLGLLVVWILVRVLRRLGTLWRPQQFEETREALDARSLLAQQLRQLFGGRRRTTAQSSEDDLPRGGIRRLYRDLLRTARRVGQGRATMETPEEYQRRLAATIGEVAARANSDPRLADELGRLTHLYEQDRYGGLTASADEQTAAQAASQHLAGWLTRRRRADGTG